MTLLAIPCSQAQYLPVFYFQFLTSKQVNFAFQHRCCQTFVQDKGLFSESKICNIYFVFSIGWYFATCDFQSLLFFHCPRTPPWNWSSSRSFFWKDSWIISLDILLILRISLEYFPLLRLFVSNTSGITYCWHCDNSSTTQWTTIWLVYAYFIRLHISLTVFPLNISVELYWVSSSFQYLPPSWNLSCPRHHHFDLGKSVKSKSQYSEHIHKRNADLDSNVLSK